MRYVQKSVAISLTVWVNLAVAGIALLWPEWMPWRLMVVAVALGNIGLRRRTRTPMGWKTLTSVVPTPYGPAK